MSSYREMFDRIPSQSELIAIKRDLENDRHFASWEDYYWSVKNLCVYDTDPCDVNLIVKNLKEALENGLNAERELKTYIDAVKILVTLYSQVGEYEKAIDYLESLFRLSVSVPDWAYHYEVMAMIRTDRMEEILKNPFEMLDMLAVNNKKSSAIIRRQRNIFKQFLVEAEKYIQTHGTVEINIDAISEAATQYGLDTSDGWKYFVSTISSGDEQHSIPEVQAGNDEVCETASIQLQHTLFASEEIQPIPNRMLEKKYSEVMLELERLERELERKRQELDEKERRLDGLNKENEELIARFQDDKAKRETLLQQIQSAQEENKTLREEIETVKKSKHEEQVKIKKNPADEIISNVHIYLYSAQASLAKWLNRYLPKSVGNWWTRAVLDVLSYEQRERAQDQNITTVEQLDLAAMLRVASRNWRRLCQIIFLTQSEYDCLQEMFNVRNRWAHMNTTLPDKKDILYDLNTIQDFMSMVGCSNEAIMDVQKFGVEVDKMDI